MSTIKTNTLTGTTSAGSISVTGEGGSTTTNLQQGLAKHWVHLDGSGTATTLDDFNHNVSSLSDHGNGSYTFTFTNNMNNINYSVQLTSSVDHGVDFFFAALGDESGIYTPPSTSAYRSWNCGSGGSSADSDHICGTVHGDLA